MFIKVAYHINHFPCSFLTHSSNRMLIVNQVSATLPRVPYQNLALAMLIFYCFESSAAIS